MKALIFAGGLGTRIRSLEPSLPKPLIKIGALPVFALARETVALL